MWRTRETNTKSGEEITKTRYYKQDSYKANRQQNIAENQNKSNDI